MADPSSVAKSVVPELEALMRRLSETPPEFLGEPRLGEVGDVHVDAVVIDLLLQIGLEQVDSSALTARFASHDKRDRNRMRSILIASWLLGDPVFDGCGAAALGWLSGDDWDEFACLIDAERWVRDEVRREELVRLALTACDLAPAGETSVQAADRLSAISTTQRLAAVSAAKAAEDRARMVREEMLRKRAEEAAAKTSRE